MLNLHILNMAAQKSKDPNFTITSEMNIKIPFDQGARRMLQDVPNTTWVFANTCSFLDMWNLAKFREIVEILQMLCK